MEGERLTVTQTYKNGYEDDCSDASIYTETESGLVASIASDGDKATITGTGDDSPSDNEYAYYEYPDSGGADNLDLPTNTYPTIKVRWRTSVSSNGLQAVIWVVYSDASEDQYTLGFSLDWKVTTLTLDSSKTLDHIRLVADDNPDSWTGTEYVYFDWVIVCAGTFTFPHVAPGGVTVDMPMKLAQIEIPGRDGDVLQRLGMKSPTITVKGDVLQGESWELSANVPHFDYIIRALLFDTWGWFTCDYPRIKCQVMYKNFQYGMETRDNKAVMTWQLDLVLYKLGDFSTFADWRWMYHP